MADIAVVSPRSAWGAANPVMHWDGRSWRIPRTALDSPENFDLDLSAVSPADIWAAGGAPESDSGALGDGLPLDYSC